MLCEYWEGGKGISNDRHTFALEIAIVNLISRTYNISSGVRARINQYFNLENY